MGTVVLYDSNFGNTKIIAETIANELQGTALLIRDLKPTALVNTRLLIVGSPINAWRPTDKIRKFLKDLRPIELIKMKAAAFDTRINTVFSGNAAKKISKGLENAGAKIIVPPKGFYVKGNEGPLADGELEKAKTWARTIAKLMK